MSKSVGIRELKAHLSRYMKEVKEGDEILVSERGRVIARLVPVEPRTDAGRLRDLLLKLSAEGKVIPPRIQKKSGRPARRKKVKGSPFSNAVIEDRR